MSRRTEIHYTCDICKDLGTGHAEWDGESIMVCKSPARFSWTIQGPLPSLDICGKCWQAILAAMTKQRKDAYDNRILGKG